MGATVSQTPFLLGLSFALRIKPFLLLWQMRSAMRVGSSRWRAEEQSHPPPAPPSPHPRPCSGVTVLPQTHEWGDVCSCTPEIRPGLTLSVSGNKVWQQSCHCKAILGTEKSVRGLPLVGIKSARCEYTYAITSLLPLAF